MIRHELKWVDNIRIFLWQQKCPSTVESKSGCIDNTGFGIYYQLTKKQQYKFTTFIDTANFDQDLDPHGPSLIWLPVSGSGSALICTCWPRSVIETNADPQISSLIGVNSKEFHRISFGRFLQSLKMYGKECYINPPQILPRTEF